MGTWTDGEPYTDPTADQVTEQVATDRDEAIGMAINELDPIDAGTPIAGVIPIQVAAGTRQIPYDPGFSLTDLGQTRGSTTSELSTQAAPFTIPADYLKVGDRLSYLWCGVVVNLTGGGGITFRIRPKLNALVLLDQTLTAGALSGFQIIIRSELLVEALSPAPLVHHGTFLTSGSGTAVGTIFPAGTADSTALAPPTTPAITFDTTTQMSATGSISTQCTYASLTRVPARAA